MTRFESRILNGDAEYTIGESIPRESAHFVCTSPPYWNVKDYETDEQIGYDDTLPRYLERLRCVWQECACSLHPGGRLAINIGDQYHATGETEDKPYHITPLGALVLNSVITARPDLLFLGTIIWRKQTNTETSGGASVMGSYGKPRNGYLSLDYEYIHLFKKPGKSPEPTCTPGKQAQAETMVRNQWNDLFTGHWELPGASQADHPAPFPEVIPRRLITMFTYPDDLVLDPFAGSGTTCAVAKQMDRRYVGIELNEDYYQHAVERCSQEPITAFVEAP